MEDIMVSVVCVTYNHESYIGNAIESFLRQNVNFTYEVIIHDDASTDKTAQIVREYEERYPNIIRGIYQKENQYSKKESWIMKDVYEECNGKYIAFCEGDDCWIDNNKLQIQVEYMEENPECMLTVHNTMRLECDTGSMQPVASYGKDKDLSPEEVIIHNERNATSSLVFRHEMAPEEEFFLDSGVGDYIVLLKCIAKGKVHYIDRIMSVYRYKSVGSWSNSMLQKKKERLIHCIRMIHLLEQYNIYSERTLQLYVIDKIQFFADVILSLLSEKNIMDLFHEAAEDFNEKYGEKFHKYLPKLARLYKQKYHLDYCSDKVKVFAQNHKYIVVMGTGKYAGIISRQLMNNDITFEGFVVSDGKKINDTYMGKNVWELADIPFNKSDTGIIIGINPIIWSEINGVLGKAGIENYVCPFLLNESDLI